MSDTDAAQTKEQSEEQPALASALSQKVGNR